MKNLESLLETIKGEIMSETINPKSIRADTPDWQEGHEQGLLSGYTKSICLIRHLQRTLVVGDSARYAHTGGQREILEKAMELISEKIK